MECDEIAVPLCQSENVSIVLSDAHNVSVYI